MPTSDTTRATLAAATMLGAASAAAANAPASDAAASDAAALDAAFETLKTFDWGADRKLLAAIDEAVPATKGNPAARQALEARLAAVLATGASRAAKDVIFRKLTIIGTAASVPALAALLPEAQWSHMARYAVERIPAPEAALALRDALPKLSGKLKVGVIGSLGARRDAGSVAALAVLLGDADAVVAAAAATALGDIASVEAADALRAAGKTVAAGVKPALADATLVCAERLLADGHKAQAKLVYQALTSAQQPKAVRLAATRGLLVAGGKQD